MRYTLEISEEQAEIIKIALEEYFRLRMNQTWDFADSLCFEDLKKNGEVWFMMFFDIDGLKSQWGSREKPHHE